MPAAPESGTRGLRPAPVLLQRPNKTMCDLLLSRSLWESEQFRFKNRLRGPDVQCSSTPVLTGIHPRELGVSPGPAASSTPHVQLAIIAIMVQAEIPRSAVLEERTKNVQVPRSRKMSPGGYAKPLGAIY